MYMSFFVPHPPFHVPHVCTLQSAYAGIQKLNLCPPYWNIFVNKEIEKESKKLLKSGSIAKAEIRQNLYSYMLKS